MKYGQCSEECSCESDMSLVFLQRVCLPAEIHLVYNNLFLVLHYWYNDIMVYVTILTRKIHLHKERTSMFQVDIQSPWGDV